MNKFTKRTLGDLCHFQAGNAFPPSAQGCVAGKYPFIKVSDLNLSGNEIFIFKSNNWVENKENYNIHKNGSIVFAKIGIALTYNRRRILTRDTIIDNNMMSATASHDVNGRFLYYLLCTIDFNDISSGSALPYLTVRDLNALTVFVPPQNEQYAIASILGSLDDKIDLNRRMNETLEAMARALFRDWFVDFGPTRAKMAGEAPYLAPELWELFPDKLDEEGKPEGWLYESVSSLGEVVCGKTPSTQNPLFYGDAVPFITIPDMHNKVFTYNTRRYLSTLGANSQHKKTLPPLSICVSCIATPGLVTLTKLPSQTNQQINSIIPFKKKNAFFIYETMRALSQEIQSQGSGGSVFFNLNTGKFKEISVLLPTQDILDFFHKSVYPTFGKIIDNDEQSSTLSQLRDLLLPKLMSGEISIRDAEKMVEDAA
ncbi:restriction endonuclease subunit S [Acetobacter senegalensis]